MLVHFTTVHTRTDTRIRIKQVETLAANFQDDILLFVQDGLGDELLDDYRIVDTGAPFKGRLRRMTLGAYKMFSAVKNARPDVAHFHDPELLPWAFLLKMSGISVIYDAHEDVPAALRSKPYLGPIARRLLARIIGFIEQVLASKATKVVAATPSIASRFQDFGAVAVQNFPLLEELKSESPEQDVERPPHFAYVGGVTKIRAAFELVAAIDLMRDQNAKLELAGMAGPKLSQELEVLPGWSQVVPHGWIDRVGVAKVLARSRAGLVVFHPEPNHVSAQPNKMFEYMAAGLPVIASDFPLWREIVEGAKCGLLVDPKDPHSIADAMRWMLDHPKEAAEMGRRGRDAVEQQFNWEAESKKLVSLYRQLLG